MSDCSACVFTNRLLNNKRTHLQTFRKQTFPSVHKQLYTSLILRYETLAVATEAENRQDPDLPLKTGGKRLTVSPKHFSYEYLCLC